ncbi:MAG: ATP-binding protein [Bacillota bacterium]|uniref:histidine kinase n=1 Tax=Virgibacillus salarius TaxID=447199 RepID=A0A941DS03_9BACI|nr:MULTISPECIES: ATP-binding protein [Bacillaceae]NAZ08233.1 HAMP domain-containing protein [Agaribacter marinus]MBR7795520.1 HAMP domain-containing protein [Virgibacillus salarius]MCC2249054.1 cell wall metabolism sensor histidine kinase WalK [Virgibacillus sp. AGTR]MDY7043414.1 ATP-binding protein [Virgibacillus sp. M23]QRZ16982.1 HAMP domain-containing protein [Virgibacillus sp. AGTR]
MFWRSVVGKLAITILLLVSFVLFILTILLLQFFEDFHIQEAEQDMHQTATKVSVLVQSQQKSNVMETTERVKDPASRVAIVFEDGELWVSNSEDKNLLKLQKEWIESEEDLSEVLTTNRQVRKQLFLPGNQMEAMIVGIPIENQEGAVFVYQSLDVIDQTKAETTKRIFLAAGIAIVLTTIFAFFLSTRITSPLIKMREAAFDLTRGEFNTKVPILTHDEIGELALAFNRMGRQLKFHLNALRQEKEQLSSIVSSMADGVITLNRSGDMIVTNSPAERFIEDWYYENNMQNQQEERKLPSELNEILQEVIEGEKEAIHELSLQGRNWVMVMTPLYDQSYVRGAVAVIRDMTEERRMDKLREDFIANVSHELRTPISMLQGYSEAIVDDIAESKEEKNELAQIIHEESLRMGRLVNELLDLARMEAGHIHLNLETVEVEKYVERILKKFNGLALDNQITLSLDKQLSEAYVQIDPDRIEQVFTNLIDNAIRHTSEQGFVKVKVSNDEHGLQVEIEDSGSGIPEEDLPFVFERFYKADKSRTRDKKKKGTGLGLAIAKNIIDAHNGIINVNSKINQGTAFSFKIPKNKES